MSAPIPDRTETALTGGCLCGAVRYSLAGAPLARGLCHCRDCQRASGSGHVPWIAAPRAALAVVGTTSSYATTGGSGRPTTRHFCPACGSLLYGVPEMAEGVVTVYAGGLDDPSAFAPQVAVYVKDRCAWDAPAIERPSFERLPPDAGQARRPLTSAGGAARCCAVRARGRRAP